MVRGRSIVSVFAVAIAAVTALTDSPASADNVITVTGQAVYTDANGNDIGVEGAKVQVCDTGLIRECEVSITGPDGSFDIVFNDTFAGDLSQVYVEVIAQSVGVQVGPPGFLPVWYCFRTTTRSIADGETLDFGVLRPLENRTCDVNFARHTDPRENAGFYVFTRLHRAYSFMNSVNSSVGKPAVPVVTARLVAEADADDTDVSFYDSVFDTITMQPYSWQPGSVRGATTIWHEYGHHLMNEFAESPPPDYVNGNCDDEPEIIIIFEIPDPGHCRWLSELGVVAWTEGVPTFLAAVFESEILGTTSIRDDTASFSAEDKNWWYRGTEFPAMRLVPTQEDVLWFLGDSDGLREEHPSAGELDHVEGWTTAVMWDVYDADTAQFTGDFIEVDDHDQDMARDTMTLPFRDIWRVITSYDPAPGDTDHNHPTSVGEFRDGVMAIIPGVSEARLAGAFLENHVTVPATEAFLGSNSYQNWDSRDVFGRGDVMSAPYEACRPASADVSWSGDMSVGVYLERSGGSRYLTLPPLALPDAAPGACVDGVYEFMIPVDLELPGPLLNSSGNITDRTIATEAFLCVDPGAVLAELDEDNCRSPHGLVLQNRPPNLVSNAGPDGYVIDEGSDLVIDLTGTTDPDPIGAEILRYRIRTDFGDAGTLGDEDYTSAAVQVFTPDETPLLADGAGPIGDIQLSVLDDFTFEFGAQAVEYVPLVVNNVAPSVAVTNAPAFSTYTIFEGDTLSVEGQFRDPGADDWDVQAFFFDVDTEWTPGTITSVDYDETILPPAYVGQFEIEKTFDDQTSGKGVDFYVCVNDDDGGEGCTQIGVLLVRVLNVAPTIDLPSGVVIDEGADFELAGSFTDPGADTWTGTVSVNGGSPVELNIAADKTFTAPLDVSQDGTQVVEVCIDDGTDVGCDTTTIDVENVAPTFSLGGDRVIDEGGSVEISTTFTDPGADVWSATVAFDGGAPAELPLTGMSFGIDRSYPDDGEFSIEVCVSDDDTTVCDSAVVEVVNVPPEVTIDSVPADFVVRVADGVVAGFTDVGALDTHTASIDWGDGPAEGRGSVVGEVTGSHAYEASGMVTIQVCVTDDDGGTGCASVSVDVLSPTEAIGVALDDLSSAAAGDPAVAAAVKELQGPAPAARSGALERIADGNFIAGVVKIGRAIDELDEALGDYEATQRLMAQVAESIARDLYSEVEALGLTAPGDVRQVERIADAIASGRAALDAGDFADAVDQYARAIRRATGLLGAPRND